MTHYHEQREEMMNWPSDEETERRMEPILQNGNDGDHYETTDKPD